MRPRSNHRPAGTYPNLLCTDALTGGRITLFRNPADKTFGEKDAYAISADWSTPDGISAAYAKAEEEERRLAAIMGFLDGITRRQVDQILRRHLNRPVARPPATQEEERQRDARDANFADQVNAVFADVRFNDFAKDILS